MTAIVGRRISGLSPRSARRPDSFYGWHIVALCALVRGFTAPGQTIGVSAFTDDLIDALGTNRSAVSTAYLIGTLGGSMLLPLVGRWVDRVGVRRSLTVVTVAFAAVVAATSTVQNIVMLTVAFFGLRFLGQGSMSLIGTQGVVHWFDRRRGLALALLSVGTVALMALAPLAFTALINSVGWRAAWLVIAAALIATVVPIARFGIVDRPSMLGQVTDGSSLDGPEATPPQHSFTTSEALRTPGFWTVTALIVMTGAVITGLTFHNSDLLGEQGLSKEQAAAIFIPALFGSVASSLLFGWLVDRISGRPLVVSSALLLAVGTFAATLASPGLSAVVYGVLLGFATGSAASVSGALFPKWFGTANIGAIQSIASTAGVAGSAVGPLLLSVGNDLSNSYEPVVILCALVSVGVAVVALAIATPANTRD